MEGVVPLTHLPRLAPSPSSPCADTELDFAMQLGRTGEVFFVSETEEEVGDDLEGERLRL